MPRSMNKYYIIILKMTRYNNKAPPSPAVLRGVSVVSVAASPSSFSLPHNLCLRRHCRSLEYDFSFLKPLYKVERERNHPKQGPSSDFQGLRFSFSTMAILGLIKRVTRITVNNSRVRVYPVRYFQRKDLSSTNLFNGEDAAKLPVLIVGAGPVGLVLSILLTKLGTIFLIISLIFI